MDAGADEQDARPSLAWRVADGALERAVGLAMAVCAGLWTWSAIELANRHDSRVLDDLEHAPEGMGGAFFTVFVLLLGVGAAVAAVFGWALLRRSRSRAASAAIVNAALGAAAVGGYLLLRPQWW